MRSRHINDLSSAKAVNKSWSRQNKREKLFYVPQIVGLEPDRNYNDIKRSISASIILIRSMHHFGGGAWKNHGNEAVFMLRSTLFIFGSMRWARARFLAGDGAEGGWSGRGSSEETSRKGREATQQQHNICKFLYGWCFKLSTCRTTVHVFQRAPTSTNNRFKLFTKLPPLPRT